MKTCPWDTLEKAVLQFCEDPLCQIIQHPSDTYSSFIFIFIGIAIFIIQKKNNHLHLWYIGLISIFIGLTSAIYHATNSFWAENFDLTSMYFITSLSISYQFKRLYGVSQKLMNLIFFSIPTVGLILILFIRPIGAPLFALLVFYAVFLEFKLFKIHREKNIPISYDYFWKFTFVMIVGWGIWWLDILKILCNPQNHFVTGHALWHFFTSLGVYCIYGFFKQFETLKRLKE